MDGILSTEKESKSKNKKKCKRGGRKREREREGTMAVQRREIINFIPKTSGKPS